MLPEVGASELVLIAIVALIVVGPKDLPVLLRKLGQFMAKLRTMAADFRSSFDEMGRQAELDELRREVDAMKRGQAADLTAAQDASTAPIEQVFADITDGLQGSGVQMHPPMSYQYEEPVAEPALEAPKAPKPRKPKAAAAASPKPRAKAAPKAEGTVTAPRKRAKTGTVT